jgi:hypothetical protein
MVLDAGVGGGTDPRRVASFDLTDDRVGGPHERDAAVGGDVDLRIGPARDVAKPLEVVEDGPDALLAPPGLPRQITRPATP